MEASRPRSYQSHRQQVLSSPRICRPCLPLQVSPAAPQAGGHTGTESVALRLHPQFLRNTPQGHPGPGAHLGPITGSGKADEEKHRSHQKPTLRVQGEERHSPPPKGEPATCGHSRYTRVTHSPHSGGWSSASQTRAP